MEAAQPTTPSSVSEMRAKGTGAPAPPNEEAGGQAGEASARLVQQTPPVGASNEETAEQVKRLAAEAFSQTGSWVVFFREVLGLEGLVRRAFPAQADYEWFLRSPQHDELQEMLAALRSNDTSKGDAIEPEKMITIRLPKSLHDVLTDESEGIDLSINKLCISKLLQPVDSRCVPVQQGRRRGRRPGPQGPRKKQESAPQTDG